MHTASGLCHDKWLFSGMIRIFLSAFSFIFYVLAAPAQQSPAPQNIAGIVNADTIRLDDFAREVGRKSELNSMGGTLTASDVMEQTWQGMVRLTLLRQQAAATGIVVTEAQADSVLLQATPDFVRRGVVNDKGKFDAALLRAMLYNPDSLAQSRMHNASKSTINKNVAAIKSTMASLRERVADMLRSDKLRNAVVNAVGVDSSALHYKYDEWCYRANADVVHLPCSGQKGQPSEADIAAWYQADKQRYSTTHPMRQLGVLSWPLIAAPFDSVLVLRNVRAFIAMINGEHNTIRRDSLWDAVASTVTSTYLRLSPDSAQHRLFYEAVVGTRDGKVGTCIGPIAHPDGLHIILVDSVGGGKKPWFNVRVILAPVEPGKATTDSILTDVRAAAAELANGATVEDVAKKYHKTFTITKWVTRSDKLFDSYRLVQAAFDVGIGHATDPIDTPDNGVVLVIPVDSIPPGPMPLEAAREQVVADIMRDLACTKLKRQAESMRAVTTRLPDGRMFVAEKVPNATIWRDVDVDGSGFVGPEVFDPTASLAIRRSAPATLMGPFRGDAGWWVANVQTTQKSNQVPFTQWLQADGQAMLREQQAKVWETWLESITQKATIVDLRWMYFRF